MIRLLIWLLGQPLLWAILGVTLGPYFFWRGFLILQRKRLIMDTPRSTIRAAALGRVEITGKAVGPYTLVAPMSHADCLYYRLVIESNPQGDLSNSIREMCTPMFLDDGTGTLMIFPRGSELLLPPSSERSEYGKLALALSRYSEGTPEFAQEYSIKSGDTIFVLGTLRENPWAKKDTMDRAGICRTRGSRSAPPRSLSLPQPEGPFRSDGRFAGKIRLPSSCDPDARRRPIRNLHRQPTRPRSKAKLEILPVHLGRPRRGPLGSLGDSQPRRTTVILDTQLQM
jgi:hypothetical protein